MLATKDALFYIVLIQYIPRFFRIIRLTSELKRTSGVFAETTWAGASYYLLWYMLASHVSPCTCCVGIETACAGYADGGRMAMWQIVGAFWYLQAVERGEACWHEACSLPSGCDAGFLYCANREAERGDDWRLIGQTVLDKHCNATEDNPYFNFGIYTQALASRVVTSKKFVSKYCYCLWWGLQNLR